MKYGLILIIFGFFARALHGDHLTLSPVKKCEFMECRLAMIESLFRLKIEELKHIETEALLVGKSPEEFQAKILHLKQDLRSLAQSLPILRNSLYALRST